MTHGFDDSGRKYDSKGILRDWWTGTDGEEHDKRAKVMIEQANALQGVRPESKRTHCR